MQRLLPSSRRSSSSSQASQTTHESSRDTLHLNKTEVNKLQQRRNKMTARRALCSALMGLLVLSVAQAAKVRRRRSHQGGLLGGVGLLVCPLGGSQAADPPFLHEPCA